MTRSVRSGEADGAAPPRSPATASAAAAPATTTPVARRSGWGLPLAVVIIGMFMSILDTSIVNVAVPTMQKEFGTTTEDIQWISTAYTLCLGVVVPASAWLGRRAGLRRIYVICLVSFSVASALCGMAWDLNSMIVFRILQAVPGGVIPVTCLTILYQIVPRQKIGTAMGLYGLGIVVAPAVGPALGGYLVEYVDWRLIFYINVPIGVIGAFLAVGVLPAFPAVGARRFDGPGFLCIATGLFALLLALSEGQDWGWTGYRVLMLLVVGVLCLALFVVIELEVDEPLLDVRVFAHWPFVNSLLLISINSIGLFAVVFYIPLFLQEGQQMQPFNAGLTIFPQAIVMGVLMPIAGRIYDRFGPRWPAIIGLLVSGVGTLLLCGINADMTRTEVVEWTMFRAAGLGLSMMPIMTGGISSLPPSMTGAGSAFNNLVQRVSMALGLAALTAMATAQQAQFMADRSALLSGNAEEVTPELSAMQQHGTVGLYPLMQRTQVDVIAQTYSNVFMVAGVLTLAAVFLAFLLRSGPAPATGEREGVEVG